MAHTFYSVRSSRNINTKGFELLELKKLFLRTYTNLKEDGYFDEYLGSYCVDEDEIKGKVSDIKLEILLKIRKQFLWPIDNIRISQYSEDDLFDMIEFLYQNVSKPIDGDYHSYGDCGMHWHTFNKDEGENIYLEKINAILALYKKPFELSKHGEILHKPEQGFETMFEADIPSNDVKTRIDSAVLSYRRHGSTLDNRRQAVRDLADVLEYLRPKVKSFFTKQDEKDLYNIANNFGIRHHNDKQKTNYDTGLWLSWMFYYYLATIHVLLRKISNEELNKTELNTHTPVGYKGLIINYLEKPFEEYTRNFAEIFVGTKSVKKTKMKCLLWFPKDIGEEPHFYLLMEDYKEYKSFQQLLRIHLNTINIKVNITTLDGTPYQCHIIKKASYSNSKITIITENWYEAFVKYDFPKYALTQTIQNELQESKFRFFISESELLSSNVSTNTTFYR